MDITSIIGKFAGGNGNMAQVATELITQSGGLEGLVTKFKTSGFESQVASWLGDGPNQAINGEAIQKVLGSPIVTQFAGKLGMEPTAFANQIATILPEVINALSSGGSFSSVATGLMGKLAGNNAASGLADTFKKLF